MKKGFVYLVGAGPGAPGLITLRGVEVLGKADVVLYDGLVNPQLLQHAKPDCNLICVGKHGQTRVWKQSEIDDEVVRWANQGLIVVRLKGGDTAIFARTAEELDRLRSENIPFEVVPGISAATAASSYAGIAITHRDWASAVAFVTGQSQAIDGGAEAEEAIDWDGLARFPGTLVFYMGVTSAKNWSSELLRAGKLPTTPVAMIRRCTWPDQQVLRTTLSELSQGDVLEGLRPPIISIVGTVASLEHASDWFSMRPLFGSSVLITRQEDGHESWGSQLEEQGCEVFYQPAIQIDSLSDYRELDLAIENITSIDWLIFTSRNGVNHFMKRLESLGHDARKLGHVQIAGVGPSVADELQKWKVRIDLIPDVDFHAEALSEKLLERFGNDASKQRCLWIRTNRGRNVLADRLQARGVAVSSIVGYESSDIVTCDPALLHRMEEGKIDFTTVSSSGIAESLIRLFGDRLKRTKLVSISSLTSQTLRAAGYEVSIEAEKGDVVQAILSSVKEW